MYRNSTDRRVHQTALNLYSAIQVLLNDKPFENISIKEVSEQAGIGRATFYRNFDYVDDVLKYQLDHVFADLRVQHPPHRFRSPAMLVPFFDFWVQNREILLTLIQADRWDIFATRFRQATTLELPVIIEEHDLDDISLKYLENSVNSLITATLYTWLENGCRETAAELQQLFILPFRLYFERLDPNRKTSPPR